MLLLLSLYLSFSFVVDIQLVVYLVVYLVVIVLFIRAKFFDVNTTAHLLTA